MGEAHPKNELAFIGANVYFRGNFKSKDEALKKFFEAAESIGLEIDAEEYTEFRDDGGNVIE